MSVRGSSSLMGVSWFRKVTLGHVARVPDGELDRNFPRSTRSLASPDVSPSNPRTPDHAAAMYAPYGKRPDPNLLYGLVYTVAAVGALLWLLVIRAVRSRRRSAPVLAVAVTTITAALALLLLASTEYGAQIFPPLWGILAFRPPRGPSRLCCSVAAGLVDERLGAHPPKPVKPQANRGIIYWCGNPR